MSKPWKTYDSNKSGFFKGALATALASQALASPLLGLGENSQEQRTKARALSARGDTPADVASHAAGKNYEATWESLAKRPTSTVSFALCKDEALSRFSSNANLKWSHDHEVEDISERIIFSVTASAHEE
jgi:hypothetical protein